MKKFFEENWYKAMIGVSCLMASFGFMINSLAPTYAGNNELNNFKTTNAVVPINSDGTISVKFTEEQLDKIIPKNEDGSINVRMSASEIMMVDIRKIDGFDVDRKYAKIKVEVVD